MNESKFHMWRACIAVILLDGKVHAKEQDWLSEKFNSLPLSDNQKKILESDFENDVAFEDVVSNITDKRDRAFLLHMIRVISHLDGEYVEMEKSLFKKWEQFVLSGVDLEAVEKAVSDMEKESYHESNHSDYKVNNSHSLFETIYKEAKKVLNKGDYDFPDE